MPDVIYSSVGCFTSVRDPYIQDDYVKGLFRQVIPADQARGRFRAFLADRPLLPMVLEALAAHPQAAERVQVVDCGVYMGNFSVAVDVQAERAGVAVEITAHEANPALIEPIRDNFSIYGMTAKVVEQGIGGQHGTLEFVHREGAMIGGTLFAPNAKTKAARTAVTTTQCRIVPLREVLAGTAAPGLVKIDIEGNEVAAFGSIATEADRLNNVFFVEFAPFQGSLPVGESRYDAFLLKHFAVFDINNWLWFPYARRLESAEAMARVMEDHPSRPDNTDLMLIPKTMPELIAGISRFGAPDQG